METTIILKGIYWGSIGIMDRKWKLLFSSCLCSMVSRKLVMYGLKASIRDAGWAWSSA